MNWFTSLFGRRCDHHVIINRLNQIEKNLMSTFKDFADKQADYNRRNATAVDSIVKSQAGLVADIDALNQKITDLQNSSGQVTPEDQALIDQLESQGAALSDRAEAVSKALEELDSQTPPVTPAVPVEQDKTSTDANFTPTPDQPTPDPREVGKGGGPNNNLPKPVTNAVSPNANQKSKT